MFPLTWLMCRAFAPNRFLAVLALPLGLLILIPYAVRRQLFETADHNGMVVFGPLSLVKDTVILAAVMSPLLVINAWAPIAWGPLSGLIVLLILTGLLLVGFLVLGSSSMGVPVGGETPKGDRYQVAALAQRPGTRLSAMQLALRLRDSLPVGAVLVAVADSDRLLEGYVALRSSGGDVAVEASADEEHSESVVLSVAEASGDAAGEFDEPVDGFGATVIGTACGEVGQERLAPAA